MYEHLGLSTTRFLSVDRRHGKDLVLLRDQRRLCQDRDTIPALKNLGFKLEKCRKGLLNGHTGVWVGS